MQLLISALSEQQGCNSVVLDKTLGETSIVGMKEPGRSRWHWPFALRNSRCKFARCDGRLSKACKQSPRSSQPTSMHRHAAKALASNVNKFSLLPSVLLLA